MKISKKNTNSIVELGQKFSKTFKHKEIEALLCLQKINEDHSFLVSKCRQNTQIYLDVEKFINENKKLIQIAKNCKFAEEGDDYTCATQKFKDEHTINALDQMANLDLSKACYQCCIKFLSFWDAKFNEGIK